MFFWLVLWSSHRLTLRNHLSRHLFGWQGYTSGPQPLAARNQALLVSSYAAMLSLSEAKNVYKFRQSLRCASVNQYKILETIQIYRWGTPLKSGSHYHFSTFAFCLNKFLGSKGRCWRTRPPDLQHCALNGHVLVIRWMKKRLLCTSNYKQTCCIALNQHTTAYA